MECLVGTWKGGGTIAMGKDKAKIDATWTPGVAAYEETDLMGYEPNTNTYHWYSVTNAGETHDHVAKVPEGNDLQFVFSGTQEGKPLREVIDLSFAGDSKSVTGRAETFVGGASVSVMDVNLRK